jgi:hypothetical protein
VQTEEINHENSKMLTEAAPGKAPKATNYADIKGQGRIPYAKATAEKTPQTATGTITKGTSRGMGAMLRGGEFTIC